MKFYFIDDIILLMLKLVSNKIDTYKINTIIYRNKLFTDEFHYLVAG
jgi:hypothetical protein